MNALETLNQSVFFALNAQPGAADGLLSLASFCANGIVFMMPTIALGLWFLGGREGTSSGAVCDPGRDHFPRAGDGVRTLWFHPRPFMIPLGHTWISHPADNSFPSDHGTVMFSAAFALLSLRLRALGLLMLLAALPVAWSRIYLGVHFPLDMVGAALVAVGGVIVAKRVWQAVGPRLVLMCEAVSRRMFSWLPARFTP
ncbi:undecaprenyl-diphosphatase [Klebsiella quasipneumoniae subsp. similipneumoniae]